jgi:hypothetical protein
MYDTWCVKHEHFFKYAIGKVTENQKILKLKRIHQFLVYADVNLLWKLNILPGNHKTLLVVSDGVGIEVNIVQTLYVFLSGDQNPRQVITYIERVNRQNLVCQSVKITSTYF